MHSGSNVTWVGPGQITAWSRDIVSYIVSLLIFAHSTVLHCVFSVLFNSKKCKQFASSCCMVDMSCGLSESLHEPFWSNCNESAQCNYTPQRISLCWTC